jgi:putative oxidoreductase
VAWLITIAEGIGGLLLIVGLFTRLVTLPLIAIMIGAIALVKVDVGFIVSDAAGAELDTALLAGLLGLLFIGPGRLSIDGGGGNGDRSRAGGRADPSPKGRLRTPPDAQSR